MGSARCVRGKEKSSTPVNSDHEPYTRSELNSTRSVLLHARSALNDTQSVALNTSEASLNANAVSTQHFSQNPVILPTTEESSTLFRMHFRITALFIATLFFLPITSTAQLTTPDLSFETYGVVSSSGTTPFWLQSNRYGMFASDGSQLLTRIQAHSTNNQLTNNLILSYGADFIARPGTQSTANFTQGYARLDAYGLFLQAGRFHNTSPIHDDELGMGSLGVSGNAPPIPQIRAGLSDWTSLPYIRDFIQIKGHMTHGWLGSKRLVKNVLYHEKVGHVRLGGSFPLNLYGGIAHYAKWGGTHPELGNIPSSFEDFFRVAIAVGGDENAPRGERDYMLGDHLGAWDFGAFIELNDAHIKVYRQFPLETKDNLKLKSLQDALTGINIQFTDNRFLNVIDAITYEFLYSKFQDGPRRPNPGTDRDSFRGNENYYNHYLYLTGWSYNRRTIGTPLFTPRENNLGISNNRVVAHHLGLDFQLIENLNTKLKVSYSRNYGNRGPAEGENNPSVSLGVPFDEPKEQLSILFGARFPITIYNNDLNFISNIAYDNGSLIGNQLGFSIGIIKDFR